jgi:hypothetical protein
MITLHIPAIHMSDVDDVRPVLQYYSQFDDPAAEFRRRAEFVGSQAVIQEVRSLPSSHSATVQLTLILER